MGVKDKNRNSGFLTKCVVTGDKGKDVAGVPGALKKKVSSVLDMLSLSVL